MGESEPQGFWSGETLSARGAALFDEFNPDRMDCNSYMLRMGRQFYRTADHERDAEQFQKITQLSSKESFVLPPGQFALLLSKETVNVPRNAMAFLSMRTRIKFQGLINVSGFHVNPGYSGQLVYAAYNASPSPIHISEDELLFKIWFCSLDRESGDKFVEAPDAGIHEITNDMVRGLNREILSLQSLADKMRDHENEVGTKFAEQKFALENLNFIWRALIIGVWLVLVGAIGAPIIAITWDLGKGWTNQQSSMTRSEESGKILRPPKPPETQMPATDQPTSGATKQLPTGGQPPK